MQRSDITKLFPDATKEQLDALMALNGADVNAAKANADELATKLQAAQEALKKAPTDAKALETAQTRLADLEKQLDAMKAADAVRQLREKVAADKNIPANLLTGDTEEACTAQADAILAFAGSSANSLSVGDGGEPNTGGKATTRAQFADWAKEML